MYGIGLRERTQAMIDPEQIIQITERIVQRLAPEKIKCELQ
jgi:hypothetical protein